MIWEIIPSHLNKSNDTAAQRGTDTTTERWSRFGEDSSVLSHGALLLPSSKNLTSMEKCFQVDLTELELLKAYKADEGAPKGVLYIHALLP